ncbi:hypothetical protein T492DRAFT_880677 [Pavlovales sp. CCMP2436]|nr:hypothetical protein T492DRAFT_880677 [Pavlovales sp. CCMP2436]
MQGRRTPKLARRARQTVYLGLPPGTTHAARRLTEARITQLLAGRVLAKHCAFFWPMVAVLVIALVRTRALAYCISFTLIAVKDDDTTGTGHDHYIDLPRHQAVRVV